MNDQEREIAQLKALVEENLELSRRNHRMLKRVRSSLRNHAIMRGIYWIIIIGSMLGIYYYLQPFFESVSNQYNELIQLPDKIVPDALKNL